MAIDSKNSLLSPSLHEKELIDPALRPKGFEDFIGQENLVRNLSVFLKAAQNREEALDHILFFGPPGLGKTTLAHIVSKELGAKMLATSGPVLTKPGDLAALLSSLASKDVLFIDEIHRLPTAVEEMLYSAMEDYKIDIVIGEGMHARSLQIALPPFTLIGATTRSGLLSAPLRDRFGIMLPLEFYTTTELAQILTKASLKLKFNLSQEACCVIAKRCRATPRIALRLLRRIRDFADASQTKDVCEKFAKNALHSLDISEEGLDILDQKYLHAIGFHFNGGPVGLETLSAILAEPKDTIEEMIEPYLMQQGLLQRTARGRLFSEKGLKMYQQLKKQKEKF